MEAQVNMSNPDNDKQAWDNFAYTVEVLLASALAQDDLGLRPAFEMPAVAAAASNAELDHREFEGGHLDIHAGLEQKVYIVFTLNDPSHSPTALSITTPENKTVQTALPAPEPNGRILLIKDLSKDDDKVFISLLRNPNVTGFFLS
jgi:hypothetical protein